MKPVVYMMLGLPGSGKTTFSNELARHLEVERLSLDVVYSKLGGNLQSHNWDEEIEMTAQAAIRTRVKQLLDQNKSVILDFCPWKKDERNEYRTYVESHGGHVKVYYFNVPKEELNRRLAARRNMITPYSHAITPDMLDAFIVRFDPPENEDFELCTDAQLTS